MSSSNFASTFAPYTPPPDDRSNSAAARLPSASKPPARPWFPSQESSQHAILSYQSGGVPTFNDSMSGGSRVAEEAQAQQNQWETRFGTRVDFQAAFAYLLGPISALILLVLETCNDYVRFHAYQSALLTTPLVFIRIFGALVNFPSFLNILFLMLIVVAQLFMAFQAYQGAAQNNLSRFYIPYIGPIADQWVSEE